MWIRSLISSRDIRFNNVLKNAGSTGVARFVGILVNLAIVPLTIGYLGPERYGVWVAVSSIIAILQLSDMGAKNALIKIVAEKNSKSELISIWPLIITGGIALAAVSLTLLAIIAIIVSTLDLRWLFKLSDAAILREAKTTIYALLAVFALNFPLSICQPVRLGLQQGHKNGVYDALGHLLNLAAVYFAITRQTGLPLLTVAAMSGTIVVNTANTVGILRKTKPVTISTHQFKQTAYDLLKRGNPFFFLQVLGVISYSLDNLILSKFLGLTQVAEFSIAFKIFSLPGIVLTLFFSGLWAAYADAEVKNDWGWIDRTYNKALKFALLLSVVSAVALLIAAPWLTSLLSSGQVELSLSLLVGMAFWPIFTAVGGAITSLLNGLHILRMQLATAAVGAALNLFFSIYLTKKIGISGPIWGTVISLTITYPFLFIHSRNSISRKKTEDSSALSSGENH